MNRKTTMTIEDFNKSQVKMKTETKDYFEFESKYAYDYDTDLNHQTRLEIAGLQCEFYNKETRVFIDSDEVYMLLTVKFRKK